MFTQRPEDPTEWAGLPAEPLDPETDAERLAPVASVDLLGMTGSVASIVIPVAQSPEITRTQQSGQGGPLPDEP